MTQPQRDHDSPDEQERMRREALERAERKMKEQEDDIPEMVRFNLAWNETNIPEGVRRERQAQQGTLPDQNVRAMHAASKVAREQAAAQRGQADGPDGREGDDDAANA